MTLGTGQRAQEDAGTQERGDAGGAGLPLPLGEGRGEGLSPTPRKHRRPNPRVFVLLIAVLGAATLWYFTEMATPPPNGITASGTIESEEVSVSSEVAGRVVELLADEGDQVKAGDILIRLDDSVPRLQWMMATIAERQLLELQLEKYTIRSPLDGVVSRRSIRVGEVASPASVLMVVTQNDPVELTLYVPEKQTGQVRIGQAAEVQVDSFPGESFMGRVSYLSSKAEFTPRNVQTQKDRLNLVFAVKVQIPNPELRLKPGMPADATLVLSPES